MPTLSGMKPDDFYNRNSSFQQTTMQAVIGWGEQAISGMTLPGDSRPITVADYGCSEGKNSIVAAGHIVAAFRRRDPERAITVVHADLPSNNFNQLFLNLNSPRTANYYQIRGKPLTGIFPMACGGSFFTQLLPSGSVHFAMSFLAVEWMDRLPDVAIPEFIGYMEAPPAAQQAFARQADDDLTRFYGARGQELASGGKLLMIIPGSDGDSRCSDGLYNVLNDATIDLVEVGKISRERYERFAMPVYFRTLTELTASLNRPGGSLAGVFTIDRAETLELPAPFEDDLARTGDVNEYASAYTGFLRAFSEPVVAGGLFEPGHDAQKVDELYDRVRGRLLAEPERYKVRNIEVAVLLTRR